MKQSSNGEEAILAPTDVLGMRLSSLTADREIMGGGETILFVEDEAFVRRVTSEVLRAAGYRVLVAKTADEAAQANDQHRDEVDLLLTDVVLPGKNGRKLANELKERRPSIAVLLVSGYAQQWTESEAAEECLPKPFSATALLTRVRQVLNQKRSRMHETNSLTRASDNA
jgi:DNA-binding NtrC family response regulator